MIEVAFPTRIEGTVKFRDRYALGDIARLGALGGLGWVLAADLGVVVGLIIGVVLVELRPAGATLDRRLAALARYTLRPGQVSTPSVTQLGEAAVVLDNGTVLGFVQISAGSLASLPAREKEANLRTVHDLMKTLAFPVELHSRQRPVEVAPQQGPPESAVVTDHLAVVRVASTPDTSLTERKRRLDERCRVVRTALTAADLHADRLTGDAFETAVTRLHAGQTRVTRQGYEPESGHQPVRRLRYITAYPTRLDLAWLADVLTVEAPGLVDVVQVATPISGAQRRRLTRTISRLEVELSHTRSPGRETTLRQQKRDAEDLVEIEGRGEVLVNYGVYIVARGATPADADATMRAVEAVLDTKRVEYAAPATRMHDAVTAASAFHPDRLNETVLVPGRAASAGFCFAAPDTVADDGIVIGRNRRDGMPVVLDRFALDAGHVTVMGKTGSGKSYWTGLMVLRSATAYDDLDIHILDPKRRDYRGITEALGGTTVLLDEVDLATLDTGGVTRYTVEDPARDNTDRLVAAVRYIYRAAARTDAKALVVIDEAHRLLTDGDRIHRDGVAAVAQLVRESRDRNTAVTLVTQNADEFTRSNEGRNILRNVDCHLFFRQTAVDTEVEDFFGLTDQEATHLRKLRTGTDLAFSEALIRGPVNTELRVEATDREHGLIENIVANGGPGQSSNSVQSQRAAEPSEKPTEGAAETQPAAAPTSGADLERVGLIRSLDVVSRASIKRFEWGLVTAIMAGEVVRVVGITALNPVIHAVVPTGLLPADPVGQLVIGGIVLAVGVEIGWILFLAVGVWLLGGVET